MPSGSVNVEVVRELLRKSSKVMDMSERVCTLRTLISVVDIKTMVGIF
jgi:hypothetical protein